MQEELITDAAMQHHTLNKMIEYWVRVSAKAEADGDYNLQNSAEVIFEGLSLATFALGEVVESKEEVK